MTRRLIPVLLVLLAGCGREPGLFVEANARAHIGMLAGTIGSRPVGTAANLEAREYIVQQLRQYGFAVRVQEMDARRHEIGVTARVANVIGLLGGERHEAVGLIAHYDSSPDAPGATDDALGVAVALETARVFAAGGRRHWSLFVVLTDAEEKGLLGAAAVVTDREFMERLRAYINLESIGSSGTGVLFEAGPGNGWLVSPWARHAPHPRGGSYALEVYQRLPNDTDFSIFKTRDIPGLNFAPIGDSYAYHTARDTPDRVSRQTISRTGENTVSLLSALQNIDITQRTPRSSTFFDINGTSAVTYPAAVHWLVAAAALFLGVIAWVRFTADAIREDGVLRWLLACVWGWFGAAAVFAAMVATTALVRAAREVYHPWYARPGRLFLLLIVVAVTVGWSVVRLGQWLPLRAHPARHPSLAWSIALPVWLLLLAAAMRFAPGAAYLWAIPLLAAGLLLAPLPPRRDRVVRAASLLVLAVAATLWLPEARDILPFLVAVFGRLPVITPAFTYAAVLAAAGAMIMPPLVAALAAERPLLRPWIMTSLLLLATAGAASAVYVAPAYTADQPLRRHLRALQQAGEGSAIWEVAAVEPGLDLGSEAPGGWQRATVAPEGTAVPLYPSRFPFVFRTNGPALGPAPASIGAVTTQPVAGGIRMRLSVVPSEPGLTVAFVLPPGLEPARTSLPGVQRLGRWTASFIAPPEEGIAWEASFSAPVADEQLRETRIVVTSARFPNGVGWQQLPAWVPQENAVWSAAATWVLPVSSAPAIAPVPALR